jgi:hypothetical protein
MLYWKVYLHHLSSSLPMDGRRLNITLLCQRLLWLASVIIVNSQTIMVLKIYILLIIFKNMPHRLNQNVFAKRTILQTIIIYE